MLSKYLLVESVLETASEDHGSAMAGGHGSVEPEGLLPGPAWFKEAPALGGRLPLRGPRGLRTQPLPAQRPPSQGYTGAGALGPLTMKDLTTTSGIWGS